MGYHGFGKGKPLMEHWDGTAWTIVPGPDVQHTLLLGIVDLDTSDAWAVGGYQGRRVRVLRAHWDGSAWTTVPGRTP